MLDIIILLIICCVLGHIIKIVSPWNSLGIILIRISAIPLIFFGGMILFFMFLFGSSETKLISRQQIDLIMLYAPMCLLIIAMHLKTWRRKRYIIPLICLFVVGIGLNAQTQYIKRIPVMPSSQYAGYSPYDERLSAYEPDNPSSFRMNDNLPVLDGATALYPVYASFYRAVYPQNEEWDSYIQCNTTSRAYENILNGSADIIFVAEASDEQSETARDAGIELEFTPIGLEAFVFIVNAQNPLENITISQIKQIYRGELTEWSQLGIKDLGKIRAFQRTKGSGSQTAFEMMIAQGEEMPVAQLEEVASSMGGLYETIADYRNFRNAIGYSFRYYCNEMLGGKQIRLLSINGIEPTLEHIADGSYPFSGSFYAVTRADAPDNVKKFVKWMTEAEGQEIVGKVGYLPLAPSVNPE